MKTPRAGLLIAVLFLASVGVNAADAPAPAASVAPKEVSSPAASTVVATAPSIPNNQIWECTTNGVRTFSSNPCGAKSSLRELNPINVMQPPAPVYRPARHYAPQSQSSPQASNYSYPVQDNSEDSYADNAYPAYPAYIAVPRPHRIHPHLNSNAAHDRPRPSAPHPR